MKDHYFLYHGVHGGTEKIIKFALSINSFSIYLFSSPSLRALRG